MKRVTLTEGLGKRLHPLTQITNKHLLPIYDKPMISYLLEKLISAEITDIMAGTGGNNSGEFLLLLENGKDFGLRQLHYV